jgi:chromosome segregation ATPase
MDLQRKTVQALARSLDEKREDLSSFYARFGARLLADSTDNERLASPVPAERVASWKALMSSRERDAQSLLDIKSALARTQELLQLKREIDRTVDAETARYRDELAYLGRAVFDDFDRYRDEISADFGDAYERASSAGATLARLEEKQDRLRRELEESGFFGQMLVQFRMAGLASNVRQQKAHMASILSSGAERLVSRGAVSRLLESGKLDAESSLRMATIGEIDARRESLKKRKEGLDAEQASIRSELERLAAQDNPARRLEELRVRIRDADKRIDAAVALVAREYCDKFMNEDGVSVLGGGSEGHSFSDMGTYSLQIEEASLLRVEIAGIRRKIEILETEIRIESLDRNIAGLKRSREEAERKIAALQNQIEKYDRGVDEAGIEIARLAARREELEKAP